MLTEVVGAVKLLGRVALSKLVHFLQVANALLPVLVGRALGKNSPAESPSTGSGTRASKFITAVTADVGLARSVGGLMEGTIVAG